MADHYAKDRRAFLAADCIGIPRYNLRHCLSFPPWDIYTSPKKLVSKSSKLASQ